MDNKELGLDNRSIVPVSGKNLKVKRTLIISIGVVLLLIGIFLIWYFYLRLDDNELHSLESKIQSDKEITKYFSDLSFSRDDKQNIITYNDGSKVYPYKLIGSFNKDFSQLSDDEKLNAYTTVEDAILTKNGLAVKCGYKKSCSTSEIDVVTSNSGKIDMYSFNTNTEEITHNYDDKDGKFQTETLTSTDSSSNSNSSNDNTSASDSTSTDTTPQKQTTPQIGMTADEVKATSWGSPAEINKTTTAGDISEQWVYYSHLTQLPDRYVYLDNGIVTAVQESN